MIRYLLPENGNFYKANLHCHTTCSDGRLTPAEIKEAYLKEGYSVVAFTDHDVFLPHGDLRDENFLPLNGFEIEINEENVPHEKRKTCHLCFVALDENERVQPIWHRSAYLFGGAVGHRADVVFDPEVPDFVRVYTPECVNEAIRIGKEHGFFVTYNHPVWSLEGFSQYGGYEGMDAMEIQNYSSFVEGYEEHNGAAYDELLRQENRLFAIAADDNHNAKPLSDPGCDSFGGYIVLKARELTYPAVAEALKNGAFYASEGPEIMELCYDEEKRELRVVTSPAVRIACTTSARSCRAVDLTRNGQTVTGASFTLSPTDGYARITVTDVNGKCAYSNAIFDL